MKKQHEKGKFICPLCEQEINNNFAYIAKNMIQLAILLTRTIPEGKDDAIFVVRKLLRDEESRNFADDLREMASYLQKETES